LGLLVIIITFKLNSSLDPEVYLVSLSLS
jgi:hypothetical protein